MSGQLALDKSLNSFGTVREKRNRMIIFVKTIISTLLGILEASFHWQPANILLKIMQREKEPSESSPTLASRPPIDYSTKKRAIQKILGCTQLGKRRKKKGVVYAEEKSL